MFKSGIFLTQKYNFFSQYGELLNWSDRT